MRLPIDRVKAGHQWQNLRHSLEQCGLEVVLIDPVKDLDDMVFAANQVFVGEHPQLGKFIVPSRMRHPSRQKEVPHYVAWFTQHGYKVVDLDLTGEYLEGHGDLLWHPDRSRIWAGYGFRSTRGGIEKFAGAMSELGFTVTPLELVDPHSYHLDTCLCPLNPEAVLIYPGAFSATSLETIRKGFQRIYELSQDESRQLMGNGIVANGRFIAPRMSESLASILSLEGLAPLVVDTSEFEKSGGSVFCMKTFID